MTEAARGSGFFNSVADDFRGLFAQDWSRVVALGVAMLLTLTLYKFGIGAAKFAASTQYWFSFPWTVGMVLATTAIAVWQRKISYEEIWVPLRFMMRAGGLVLFLQVVIDAFYPTAWASNLFIGEEPENRLLIALALVIGIASLWRPSFLLAFGVAYFAFRYHVAYPFGLHRTSLDFQVLADAFTFPAAAVIAWSVFAMIGRWLPEKASMHLSGSENAKVWQQASWAIVVGTHLGNYFHSALAKMYIGGPYPFFWLFNNPTQNTLTLGLYRYNNPLAQWPELVQTYFDTMVWIAVPMNIAVFLIQLLAPIAPVRRRLLIIFTLAFDAMHLGIYFSLGVFFFFWIALNVIILVSLARIPKGEYTAGIKLIAMASCFWGYFFFYQAGLGWLDGRKVVRENFYAVTTEGDKVLVPPATFGLFTYQMAHGDLYIPEGHFLMRAGGNATISDWEEASTCAPGVEPEQPFVAVEDLERLVTMADRNLRTNPWLKDLGVYYFYPHHAPSNPAFFTEYNTLSMDDIVGYTYIVESACLDLENGRLTDDIRVRTEIPLGTR